ncbi:hypothetical protein J5X84_37195 [Streptosporangiaceae bacterium NEAU-GS5]|nr:hypothetical protein [Streptosporangiaceae bacterium NEAU-GS5]
MDIPPASTPIVCDMTDAPDTDAERIAEYRRLFDQVLVGRERTGDGIRFRFRADPGVEDWVRDLAAREKACCPFYAFEVGVEDGQVVWDAAVPDNDAAKAVLDAFYELPDHPVESLGEFGDRLSQHGLSLVSNPAGTVHRLETT